VSYGKIWRLTKAPFPLLQQVRNTPQQDDLSRELDTAASSRRLASRGESPARALLAEIDRRSRRRRLARGLLFSQRPMIGD
jgi:hypothetical protein